MGRLFWIILVGPNAVMYPYIGGGRGKLEEERREECDYHQSEIGVFGPQTKESQPAEASGSSKEWTLPKGA